MKKMILFMGALLLACSIAYASAREDIAEEGISHTEEAGPIADVAALTVDMMNQQGERIGRATISENTDKVRIHLEAEGLPPGKHALHFHEFGKCEGPDFKSAGGHFNPYHTQHGFNNPKGFHAGDLPNIEVDASGKVKVDMISAAVTLKPGKPNSLKREGGLALIIHAKADDYMTDPSGASGDRIACGVVR
ncbi:superoxide dismutase family protein [Paenibacillus chungangensis]|uniref:Superoxide dismutase family protein n=1 Tax=Paenibacillus chungangensis TaxID=696535 RepID=A0ABW3HKZ1_9BACL